MLLETYQLMLEPIVISPEMIPFAFLVEYLLQSPGRPHLYLHYLPSYFHFIILLTNVSMGARKYHHPSYFDVNSTQNSQSLDHSNEQCLHCRHPNPMIFVLIAQSPESECQVTFQHLGTSPKWCYKTAASRPSEIWVPQLRSNVERMGVWEGDFPGTLRSPAKS